MRLQDLVVRQWDRMNRLEMQLGMAKLGYDFGGVRVSKRGVCVSACPCRGEESEELKERA